MKSHLNLFIYIPRKNITPFSIFSDKRALRYGHFETNYSFGKLFRTSTLCMTQVIFPTIVYIQIISLVTLSQFQWVKNVHTLSWQCLLTAWTIPENYVMALEASDRLIDIIWVNWRCTCRLISKPTFKLSASLLEIMGNSKDISQDLIKKKFHPWDQFPNAWRYHVHLYKQ
jgi:hypothetical protein